MLGDASSPPDGPPSGRIHPRPEGDRIVAICMEGEIDRINAPELLEHAARAIELRRHLVIDLSDATFVDSSAIHALVKVRTNAEKAGCVAVLQMGTAATVERAIEITGLEQVMPRVESRVEAIETINQLAGDGA